jgi:hypothetical protein
MKHQHWLDGFAMYDVDTGKIDGCLWSALFSLDWWRWQVQLKAARMHCRLRGHRFTLRYGQACCTRCDWYD